MRSPGSPMAAARRLAALAWIGLAAGCGADPTPSPASSVALFVPTEMRIHPVFTQVASLAGGATPDGIEAQLEFQDQFHDPTKASGRVLFELFEYRREPPYTGRRLAEPWVASLATPDEQRERWNKTLRTYRFALAYPAISTTQDYVLKATFELTGGGRFFQMLVLSGHRSAEKSGGTKLGF